MCRNNEDSQMLFNALVEIEHRLIFAPHDEELLEKQIDLINRIKVASDEEYKENMAYYIQ